MRYVLLRQVNMFYKDFLGLEAELPHPLPQSLKCGLLARPFSFGVGYSDVVDVADLTNWSIFCRRQHNQATERFPSASVQCVSALTVVTLFPIDDSISAAPWACIASVINLGLRRRFGGLSLRGCGGFS
jgi:hypothetical protein